MAKLQISEDVTEKLERAAAIRWIDDQGDPDKCNALADERAALTAELTTLFGPIVRQLVEAQILSVHVKDGGLPAEPEVTVSDVHVDDEFGIILDCGVPVEVASD
jgi:hypothetical protein